MAINKFVSTRNDKRSRLIPFSGGLDDGSTLNLDFTRMGTGADLSARGITFSRSSSATFINSSGYVDFPEINLFRNSSWSDSNTPPTNWTGTGNASTIPSSGQRTFTVTTAATSYISEAGTAATLANGLQYTASVDVVSLSGSVTFGNLITATASPTDSKWYLIVGGDQPIEGDGGDLIPFPGRVVFTFTSGTSSVIRMGVGVSGTNQTNQSVTLKNPMLTPGIKINTNYVPSASSTAAYYGPRFDHDPTTLAPRGLLIEASATNLVNRSEDFGAADWLLDNSGATNPVVTVNHAAAPDGNTTADRIQFNKTGGTFSRIRNSFTSTGTSGANYTFSVWMRTTSGTGTANVGLRIGAETTGENKAVTGTWQRFQRTVAVPTTDIIPQILLWDNIVGNDETADVLVWGAQLEAGSGASSYIPTGPSTVQRAADSCGFAASASWLNTANGTFVVNWHRGEFGVQDRGVLNTDYVQGRWLGLSHASASNTVNLGWWSGQISRSTGAAINKSAYTYGQTTGSGATLQLPVRLSLNGSAVATGTFGDGATNGTNVGNPVNWTNFMIGAAASSAPYTTANRDWLNNCVRSIKYWPTVLPDALLQSLTQ